MSPRTDARMTAAQALRSLARRGRPPQGVEYAACQQGGVWPATFEAVQAPPASDGRGPAGGAGRVPYGEYTRVVPGDVGGGMSYRITWRASPWFLENVDPGSAPVIEIAAADAAAAEVVVADLLDAFPGEAVGDETDCLMEICRPGGETRVVRVPS